MCELAVKHARQPLMVDPWEAQQTSYVPTAKVLDHFDREINQLRGGCNGKKVRIALLAGADLVETFGQPNVWALRDLQHILGNYGAFVVERANSNIEQALSNLSEWRDNIHYIPAIISNPMSSTMLRLLLKGNMSIEYVCFPLRLSHMSSVAAGHCLFPFTNNLSSTFLERSWITSRPTAYTKMKWYRQPIIRREKPPRVPLHRRSRPGWHVSLCRGFDMTEAQFHASESVFLFTDPPFILSLLDLVTPRLPFSPFPFFFIDYCLITMMSDHCLSAHGRD